MATSDVTPRKLPRAIQCLSKDRESLPAFYNSPGEYGGLSATDRIDV